MAYNKPALTNADLDMMWQFQDTASGNVLDKKFWSGSTVPQGVSVFLRHGSRWEYLFTKDERYDGTVDFREADHKQVVQALNAYAPQKEYGKEQIVMYLNEGARAAVRRHMRNCGCHA